MKNRLNFIFSIVIIFSFIEHSNCQVDKSILNLHLKVVNESIKPIDKIFYKFFIINNSSNHVEIKPPFVREFEYQGFGSKPLLEYRSIDESVWIKFSGSTANGLHYDPIEYRNTFIQSKDSIKSPIFGFIPVIVDSNKYEYHFKAGESYFIRAFYPIYYIENGEKIEVNLYSNEVKVDIVDNPTLDFEAFQWIKNLEVPHFMYLVPEEYYYALKPSSDPNYKYNIIEDKLFNDANILIQRYPKSELAQWAKYFLARFLPSRITSDPKKRKVEAREKIKQAKIILSSLETSDKNLQRLVQQTLKYIE